MGEAQAPSVFTIPPHRAFADALAEGLLKRWGKDPLALARGIVLVPNNRAGNAVISAFVRRAEGGLLLPRLVPIGDPDLDERLGSALDPIGQGAPLPPAIDPVRRRMILARLVQEERARAREPVDAAEAIRLAAELARTLDQLLVERVDPARLKTLEVAPELSEHWQKSLALLTIILDRWPAQLERLGRIDMVERRNLLLDRIARRWREQGSGASFVAAAGITSTAPAVAGLLKSVAWMDNGLVVLPGLDDEMPGDEWDALGPFARDPVTGTRRPSIETHPQFHLKLLLDRMDVGRAEVQRWAWSGGHDARAERSRAISNAMKPALFTGRWSEEGIVTRLSGIRALEVATPAEEAQAIALALREALETPERTAALVTPDRALAIRVSAHLKRWGIEADDSAGRPLSTEAPGTLLLAIAEAAAENFAPVPLLALLKHPLVKAGEERLGWLEKVRHLDLALRGPRPPAGLEGVSLYLQGGSDREQPVRRRAQPGWAEARTLLDPLADGFGRARLLGDLLGALRDAATALGGDGIWSGPAGRALADLLADLEAHAMDGPGDARPEHLAPLLKRMMDEIAIRPPQGGHPRISIWGLLEARLQQSDLMVLAGLNEGSWPSLPSQDPWLAPRVRSELGLASLERRIGLSAHDLANALGGPKVLVTRARRDARAPTIASRFWLRMEAMAGPMKRVAGLDHWIGAIDRPGTFTPAGQPAPVPPIEKRPRTISVTDVDRLKADPYAFYAQKMLRLRALDPIDADPSAAWRGTAAHDVLEIWAKEDGWKTGALEARARALFERADTHPVMRVLWQPRLMEALEWISAEIAEGRLIGRIPVKAEAWGALQIAGVELGGRIDRIDRFADGSLAVIDYKTGSPPSSRAVREGFSMQLGLLGLIAEEAGFEDVLGRAAAFEYWSLARGKTGFGYKQSPVDESGRWQKIVTAEFTAIARHNFIEAAERWLTGNEAFTAKLHPEYAPYGDYDQLMRLDEWYGRDG
ncbi:double-strand break repair protein AddB [Sphingomonas sp. C3-2]|uniref:double-strand break repair protein AddB n=1 Tax=Sphingomonas sp. C3-2 TaxID=3062169 RepID=UPI00294B146C|nr:double-strand break repair protein AddB [Sphingomonas sp. C3-2]WOK37007.1 double-strand break repair protein AddB [Sphingomonas sp. C3-2]